MIQPPMHPYQIYAKEFVKSHPKCGLFFDMGLGKAVDDKTLMPTPDGWKHVGDMRPGDRVFDQYGETQAIEAVYKHPGIKGYEVTLSDGRQFRCCQDHLLPLYDERTGKTDVRSLKDILRDYRNRHYRLPPSPEVEYPNPRPLEEFIFDGTNHYILGIIVRLATQRLIPEPGSVTELSFPAAISDADKTAILKTLERIGPLETTKCGNYRYAGTKNGIPFLDDLDRRNDLARCLGYVVQWDANWYKYLPDFVTMASPQDRLAFLKGFLLIPESKLDRKTGKIFTDGSWQLSVMEQVAAIAFGLGLDARIRKGTGTQRTLYVDFKPAKPPEIIDVKPCMFPLDMTCFTVTGRSKTYLINDYIVTHNTLITLMALYELNEPGHVLVVAPKNIARATWTGEIDKWQIPIRTQSLIVNARYKDLTRNKRLELYEGLLDSKPAMHFINRELLVDLIKNLPKRHGGPVWPFPTVIIDEVQSFKSYKSERFKALKPIVPIIDRFVELTGTPTPEGLMDLWPEIYLIDEGARLGKSITAYRNQFFRETLRVNGYPVRWEPLPGMRDEIYRRIGDVVISMYNPNIQLPAVTYNDFRVFMDPEELKLYRQFAKEQVLPLVNGDEITVPNQAVLKNKLVQMASGSIYTNTATHEFMTIHEHKLDACESIISNSSGSVLIAYHYQADKTMLLGRFPDAEVFDGTPAMIERWNNKEIPIMLIQPASAGHGLNIQYGGHTLIWYTIYPNLEEYLQTNARLARQGQKDPVVIHHVLCDKTVDDGMLALLQHKNEDQKSLIEAVDATDDVEQVLPTLNDQIMDTIKQAIDAIMEDTKDDE